MKKFLNNPTVKTALLSGAVAIGSVLMTFAQEELKKVIFGNSTNVTTSGYSQVTSRDGTGITPDKYQAATTSSSDFANQVNKVHDATNFKKTI